MSPAQARSICRAATPSAAIPPRAAKADKVASASSRFRLTDLGGGGRRRRRFLGSRRRRWPPGMSGPGQFGAGAGGAPGQPGWGGFYQYDPLAHAVIHGPRRRRRWRVRICRRRRRRNDQWHHHGHRLLLPRHAHPHRSRRVAGGSVSDRRPRGDRVRRGPADQMDRTAQLWRALHHGSKGYPADLHQGRRARRQCAAARSLDFAASRHVSRRRPDRGSATWRTAYRSFRPNASTRWSISMSSSTRTT